MPPYRSRKPEPFIAMRRRIQREKQRERAVADFRARVFPSWTAADLALVQTERAFKIHFYRPRGL